MAINKTLTLGILAALAAGALIGAVQATYQGTVDPSPMTIPSSHVGDGLVFAVISHDGGFLATADASESVGPQSLAGQWLLGKEDLQSDPQSSGSAGASRAPHIYYLQIAQLGKTLDRTGMRHDIVVIRQNETAEGSAVAESYEHVDLGARVVIRSDFRMETQKPFQIRYIDSSFENRGPTLGGIALQGRTIRLGEDLTREAQLNGVPSSGLLGDTIFGAEDFSQRPDDPSITEWSFQSKVTDRAIVNGHDAYAIRTTFHGAAQLSRADVADARRDGIDAGDGRIDAGFERVLWASADSPYPIVETSQSHLDAGGLTISKTDSTVQLIDVHNGTGPSVPWGRDEATAHFRTANPDVERTAPGIHHPGDGTGSRLAYPLSAALSDVDGDVRLSGYQSWKLTHAGAYLVSAELAPGERSNRATATAEWRLVFAVPSGAAFQVTTERVPGVPLPYAEDRGEMSMPGFRVDDIPEHMVTLGAAERLWQGTTSDTYRDRVPNYVHWGYFANYTYSKLCLGSGMGTGTSSSDMFRHVSIGWTTYGSCIDQGSVLEESVLGVATMSGNLTSLREERIDFHPPKAYDVSVSSVDFKAERVPGGIQGPRVETVAFAGGSLLAIFLALYFLPALKFLGTKGILALPFYAKLRKEELLDNKVRDQLLQVVKNDPGINTTDLSKRVDAGWGTIVYHLDVLEKNNLVSSLIDGRYHRFFPMGVVDFSARGQIAVMKNERTKALFQMIAEAPGLAQEQLAHQMGVSAPAAIWHLRKLEDVGLVGRVKKGRKVHYYANEGRPLAKPKDSEPGVEIQ